MKYTDMKLKLLSALRNLRQANVSLQQRTTSTKCHFCGSQSSVCQYTTSSKLLCPKCVQQYFAAPYGTEVPRV